MSDDYPYGKCECCQEETATEIVCLRALTPCGLELVALCNECREYGKEREIPSAAGAA